MKIALNSKLPIKKQYEKLVELGFNELNNPSMLREEHIFTPHLKNNRLTYSLSLGCDFLLNCKWVTFKELKELM